MSSQVVRVQGFSKGSLGNIGNEAERRIANHRNKDIDPERTRWNMVYKQTDKGFYAEWNDIKARLNVQYKDTKNGTAFEGMVITAEKKFFEERFGYKDGEPFSRELCDYWDECYEWLVGQVGFRGTDANIISAIVHADETSLHLQAYYLPITERWQEKVYAKGEDGKVLRTERGTPIQAKDEKGKTIYKQVEDSSAPKLSKTEFWRARGGQHSYRRMQDSFHEVIGKRYGLERGEVGSDREHRTKNQWESEQLRREKEKLETDVQEYRELKTNVDEISHKSGKKILPGLTVIKTKELDTLKEQAKGYTANRDEIETSRERSAAVSQREQRADLREQSLDQRERELENRQAQVHQMLQRQYNVNQLLVNAENENARLKKQNASLAAEIGGLRAEIGKLKENFTQELQSLKMKLKVAYGALAKVVKAVGMLKYDDRDGYKIEQLNKRQERLIDGVAEYVAERAKAEGFHDLADDVEKHIGISAELEPHVKVKSDRKQSRDSGPEL